MSASFTSDPHSLLARKSLYKLYDETYTPWELDKPIFGWVCELGITVFSTPFDDTVVDPLESLEVLCCKKEVKKGTL